MPFDAVVFDLDGTLVETAPDLHASLNHVLRQSGRPPVPFTEIRKMIGDGARAMIERGCAAAGDPPNEAEFEQMVSEFLHYYANHLADSSRPFPGAVDCLERLKAAGCRLGVCTNKLYGFSVDLLDQLDLSRYFEAIVGGDTLPVRKPDGDHLWGTLAAMDVVDGSAVMVGDSLNDVKAARTAGWPVVAVTFGYTAVPPSELGADLLIDHYDQLPGALDCLAAPA